MPDEATTPVDTFEAVDDSTEQDTDAPVKDASKDEAPASSTPAKAKKNPPSKAMIAKAKELGFETPPEDEPPAEATQTPKEKKADPATPQLTKAQQQAAEFGGLTAEDIKAMGDAAPTVLDKLAKSRADTARKLSELGRATQAQTASRTSPNDGSEPEQDADEPFDPATLEDFDPETYGDDGVKLNQIIRTVKMLHAENAEMRTYMEQRREEDQQKREHEAEAETDAFFGELDTKVFERFGTGSLADLDDDAPELQARLEVTHKAAEIRAGYTALHPDEPPLPLRTALDQALLIVAANETRQVATRDHKAAIDNRSRQRTSRPTPRIKIETLSPEEAKAKHMEELKVKIHDELGMDIPIR